jgi:hypothetical protein
MDALNMGMQSLAHSIAGVYCPDARGTLRSGTGYKQDWDNELHPTQSGFGKIVDAALIKQMAALGFANP